MFKASLSKNTAKAPKKSKAHFEALIKVLEFFIQGLQRRLCSREY